MSVRPEELSEVIHGILTALREDGKISIDGDIPAVKIERPRKREHGDWATNIAMQLAKRAGMNPRELAELIAGVLRETDGIAEADIAGPGFLNIRLSAASIGELARTIVEAGLDYGRSTANSGDRKSVV